MAIQPAQYPRKNIDKIVNDSILAIWILENGDVGERVKSAEFADKTIHFHDEFGTGGEVGFRGSNKSDPDVEIDTDWFTLTDILGNGIVGKTSPSGFVVIENTLWVSPECTDGDGSTLIGCSLLAKKDT